MEGLARSLSKYVSCEEAKNKKLIDIRRQGEYDYKHLNNAILVTWTNAKDWISKLEKVVSKNSSFVIYCAHGHRTELAYKAAKDNGYTNIQVLEDGLYNGCKDK